MPYLRCSGSAGTLPHTWLRPSFVSAGGQVQIYSEPGIGTTITALLPASNAAQAAPDDTAAPAAPYGRGETILIVEDEPRLRALAERILGGHGYTVITAATGEDAIALADELPAGRIDLLLTDMVLPRMLGTEIADRMRQTRPHLQVIYTSGYPLVALTSRKTIPPDVTLLSKPASPAALLAAVRQILDAQ